jgi:lantibiotic leader peptide-processing serine protease
MLAAPAGAASGSTTAKRYVVVAKTDADMAKLAADARRAGASVVKSFGDVRVLVVTGTPSARAALAANSAVTSIERDHVVRLIDPDGAATAAKRIRASVKGPVASVAAGFAPDPAFRLTGLMWDYNRIDAPGAWKVTAGSPNVKVAVADTGLDYTHRELRSKVSKVVDFTTTESPAICKSEYGVSDRDLARHYGVPANLDFNGHGSWIGGNIAGAVNGVGTNGIAPGVDLVALKISQWCGSAYDSELIASFLWAANHDVDVVSISFGGYLDRTDKDQDAVWRAYKRVVAYAWSKGTTIVASAGNEHVRVDTTGRVISHGLLTAPGDPVFDLYGWYEAPGGVPGVVNVSSTGNVVAAASARCTAAAANTTSATCKPTADRHDPIGAGRENQLAYYSNYGPGIDVAAPGGARKFNLPVWDRGGTPGFPYTTADGTKAFQTFSITSNYAQEIPCVTFTGGGFPPDQCYSTIQGTSMAAPHVSAVIALIASAHPSLQGNPAALVAKLKATTTMPHNATPGLSATDHSAGDLRSLYPDRCADGFCHLGGPAISDAEAYGAGLINAGNAVR